MSASGFAPLRQRPTRAAAAPSRSAKPRTLQSAQVLRPQARLTVGPIDEVFNLAPPGAEGGVCWYPVRGGDRTMWTTVDRAVAVTVTVPGPSEGSGQSVAPFSAAVGQYIDVRDAGSIPTGCSATPPTS